MKNLFTPQHHYAIFPAWLNNGKIRSLLLTVLAGAALLLSGCGNEIRTEMRPVQSTEAAASKPNTENEGDSAIVTAASGSGMTSFQLSGIPEYSGSPYIEINGNVPFFEVSELTETAFESYSELDSLGRCGAAYANVCRETMPTEERGAIGSVKPTAWHSDKYDFVDGKYLYNRCHLIGYQLTAENANPQNLITGTRYLNVTGMLPFENMTADYVKETDGHVLYRVTPIFNGDNLLASGVLMEAESVEDQGESLLFCVYVYNVQPGVGIDYATGDNWIDTDENTSAGGSSAADSRNSAGSQKTSGQDSAANSSAGTQTQQETFILNTNSGKFHRESCSQVSKIKKKNRKELTGTIAELEKEGYQGCKICVG